MVELPPTRESQEIGRLRLDARTPLIDALEEFLSHFSYVHGAWLAESDLLVEHSELLMQVRPRVAELVTVDVVPPVGTTPMQFASSLLNLVAEAANLSRSANCLSPTDQPADGDDKLLMSQLHERLPIVYEELRKAFLHLKHVASLDATGVPSGAAPPAIDDAERTVLGILAKDPRCVMKQEELAAEADISRSKLRQVLTTLREQHLVHRPLGDRKGDQITSHGLDYLEKLTRPHSE